MNHGNASHNFARRYDGARGFTLVEATMSVVIVSVVLVSALGTFGGIARARQVQVDRAAATLLAQRVTAEVLQCYYQEPSGAGPLGPDAGESSRAAYDDVDDYDGWNASPPVLRDGTAMDGFAGWKVKVRVQYAAVGDPDTTGNLDTGL